MIFHSCITSMALLLLRLFVHKHTFTFTESVVQCCALVRLESFTVEVVEILQVCNGALPFTHLQMLISLNWYLPGIYK